MTATTKLGYIDALRGIAILLVVLVHASQWVGDLGIWTSRLAGLGQYGVQVFFVASAYTLSRSWERRRFDQHRFRAFYLRRIFRIAPLYYFAILVYFGVASLRGHKEDYTVENIADNLLFIHGFVPSANNGVVPGGWSIGTEMAFYAIFPILLYSSANTYKYLRRATFGLLPVIALLELTFALQLKRYGIPVGNNSFVYFNLAMQLPVFLIGIATYVGLSKNQPAKGVNRGLLSLGLLLFGGLTASLLWGGTDEGALLAITTAGVASAFLLKLLKSSAAIPDWLRSVGRVSYSMYVFHFLFVWLLSNLLSPWILVFHSWIRLAILFTLSSIVTYLAARVSEQLIENRGIWLGEQLIACRRSFSV